MRSIKAISILALLGVLMPFGTSARHFEGLETNVVIIECYVPTERVEKVFKGEKYTTRQVTKPPQILVKAISFNATSAPIPTITAGGSCAQALHEYLTGGFEFVQGVSLGEYVYTLTRKDQSKVPH